MEPARLRFWGVVVPIHAGAFLVLYAGTFGPIQEVSSHAGAENPHLFGRLVVLSQALGLRLYGPGGKPMELRGIAAGSEDGERARALPSDIRNHDEVWVEKRGARQWVRGVVRLSGDMSCLPCHQLGRTLGAATMRIDYTEELETIQRQLRVRVGLLLAVWLTLVSSRRSRSSAPWPQVRPAGPTSARW